LNIKDLDFKYEKSDDNILKKLNLSIKENEKIVIRGKTGSGKTTFFKVLTGLYP
jgi:ABC-type bacteriocin/lantibiotic exporter with double-glycine peptidase domain